VRATSQLFVETFLSAASTRFCYDFEAFNHVVNVYYSLRFLHCFWYSESTHIRNLDTVAHVFGFFLNPGVTVGLVGGARALHPRHGADGGGAKVQIRRSARLGWRRRCAGPGRCATATHEHGAPTQDVSVELAQSSRQRMRDAWRAASGWRHAAGRSEEARSWSSGPS
jgi:hypothetical protein